MSYNFSIAKEKVTDNDMLRFACLFLNRRPDGTIDYVKATSEFGAKSIESMRVCTNAALKKIENAGGKTAASASTSTTPKKGGGRKRKATSADDNDDEEEPAPVVKKKGRKSKKTAETPAEAQGDSAVADDATIKSEPANEGEEDNTT